MDNSEEAQLDAFPDDSEKLSKDIQLQRLL